MLDRIDKAILKLLLQHKHKLLSINSIAKKVGCASLTAKRHLEKLEKEGYVYHKEEGKVRNYGEDKSTG